MTKLEELYRSCGQSPWLDNIKRSWLKDGTLESFIKKGVRGLTSNPTIFAKAIESETTYDEQFKDLLTKGLDIESAYIELTLADISQACNLLGAIYNESGGKDGFVSLEVSPEYAYDTENTIQQAKQLSDRLKERNLLVKVPAVKEGLPAIKRLIADGISVNVTLIFSIARYQEVINKYLEGLEERVANNLPIQNVNSVASFFVSRVDTEVDARLEKLGTKEALELRGLAAIAQAKLAYQVFRKNFESQRFLQLKKKGANLQRPLWASTSTKNPAYPDLKYVDNLIARDSVNTMPDQTIEAFLDHGNPRLTIEDELDKTKGDLEKLEGLGINLEDVAQVLEKNGVKSFKESYEDVLKKLEQKARRI